MGAIRMASRSFAVASALLTVLSVGQPSTATAQSSSPTQVRQGGYFANMFRFEFRPGKSDEGLTILRDTLIPAYRKAGIDVQLIEDMVGTKDVYLIVPLRDGPAYYSFQTPPQDVQLWRELIKSVGGDEGKAEKRLDAFINLLVRQSQTLVFISR